MKAQELRIGNWVYNPYDEKTQVDFNILHYIGLCNMNKQMVENYRPIPLTEEWLLKLGFEKLIDGIWRDSKDWIEVLFHDMGVEVMIDSVTTRNKRVHQLQNLYFALTGEELTIKELKEQE